jgi:hypothetical protein
MNSSTLFGFLFIIGIIAFIYGEMSRKLQQDILLTQQIREDKREARQQIREDKREARQQLLDQQQQMFDDRQAEREQRQADREDRFQERMAEKQHRDVIMLDAMANRPLGPRRRRRRPFVRQINNIKIVEKNRKNREEKIIKRQVARNANRDASRAMRREKRRRGGSEGFASYQSGTIN